MTLKEIATAYIYNLLKVLSGLMLAPSVAAALNSYLPFRAGDYLIVSLFFAALIAGVWTVLAMVMLYGMQWVTQFWKPNELTEEK
jgi:hypothetical protein